MQSISVGAYQCVRVELNTNALTSNSCNSLERFPTNKRLLLFVIIKSFKDKIAGTEGKTIGVAFEIWPLNCGSCTIDRWNMYVLCWRRDIVCSLQYKLSSIPQMIVPIQIRWTSEQIRLLLWVETTTKKRKLSCIKINQRTVMVGTIIYCQRSR